MVGVGVWHFCVSLEFIKPQVYRQKIVHGVALRGITPPVLANPGCAARPWALGCNAFGVKTTHHSPTHPLTTTRLDRLPAPFIVKIDANGDRLRPTTSGPVPLSAHLPPRVPGRPSMRRAFVCLLALGCLAAAVPARAQESVEKELEFVRKLRAKGYIDLAQARLQPAAETQRPGAGRYFAAGAGADAARRGARQGRVAALRSVRPGPHVPQAVHRQERRQTGSRSGDAGVSPPVELRGRGALDQGAARARSAGAAGPGQAGREEVHAGGGRARGGDQADAEARRRSAGFRKPQEPAQAGVDAAPASTRASTTSTRPAPTSTSARRT